ncbi:MAG: hypothetical protein RQ833_12295 [Sphingomonadaceae bacterium]|nr:hypothetical protein [Sphingomonadaceae bacterium]
MTIHEFAFDLGAAVVWEIAAQAGTVTAWFVDQGRTLYLFQPDDAPEPRWLAAAELSAAGGPT